jgi:hypothetical protein
MVIGTDNYTVLVWKLMIFVYTPTEFNFEKEFSQDVKSV